MNRNNYERQVKELQVHVIDTPHVFHVFTYRWHAMDEYNSICNSINILQYVEDLHSKCGLITETKTAYNTQMKRKIIVKNEEEKIDNKNSFTM